jgi:hypothetical protein
MARNKKEALYFEEPTILCGGLNASPRAQYVLRMSLFIFKLNFNTVVTRGRPSANAANSYLEFPACKSQKFGHWARLGSTTKE